MGKSFELVQRLEVIRELCRGRKTLHLGCANFPYTRESIEKKMLLHIELGKSASKLYGVDSNQEGLDILSEHGIGDLYRGDLETLGEVALSETYDVIIAGECIEHLNNPGLFLTGVKRFMNPESLLVLTTVNAYSAMRFFIYAFRGKRGTNEPVHPDHVAYYSYSTLVLLLRRHEFQIEKFMFYDLGNEHRPYNRWIYNFVNDIGVAVAPQLADGVMAVCRLGKKKDQESEEIV